MTQPKVLPLCEELEMLTSAIEVAYEGEECHFRVSTENGLVGNDFDAMNAHAERLGLKYWQAETHRDYVVVVKYK